VVIAAAAAAAAAALDIAAEEICDGSLAVPHLGDEEPAKTLLNQLPNLR
jgi:hypothetical protein